MTERKHVSPDEARKLADHIDAMINGVDVGPVDWQAVQAALRSLADQVEALEAERNAAVEVAKALYREYCVMQGGYVDPNAVDERIAAKLADKK